MTRVDFHFNVADKIDYGCRLIRKVRKAGQKAVVFCDDEFEQWGEHPGGAVAFLRDLMSGRFRHDLLDEHLEGCAPVFEQI